MIKFLEPYLCLYSEVQLYRLLEYLRDNWPPAQYKRELLASETIPVINNTYVKTDDHDNWIDVYQSHQKVVSRYYSRITWEPWIDKKIKLYIIKKLLKIKYQFQEEKAKENEKIRKEFLGNDK